MKYITLLLLCFCIGCSTVKKEKVDLLVYNATVYTVDNHFSTVTAFAVKDGKFIAVGSTEDLQYSYEAEETINANQKAVYPGFYDAHCHFYGFGVMLQEVNLYGTNSFDEVVDSVQAFQQRKKSPFIIGRGWDQNDWAVKEFPNKKVLDSLFPDTPVVLQRIDGHAYVVNQKVLDLAKITTQTKVVGGVIEQQNGELTGILIDEPMALVDAIIPSLTVERQVHALKEAESIALSYGLTTVNDAGLDRQVIELIDSVQQQDILKIKMYAMVSNSPENVAYYLKHGVHKTPKLSVRSFKVYGDGALGSRGAALKMPYHDKHNHFGAMVTSPEAIEKLANKVANSAFQLNTHAIGDSANITVLKAYTKALAGKTDKRWKVEHAQIITNGDVQYFNSNIIPSVQPTHATSDMYWVEDRLGEERMPFAYAYKTLLNKSGMIALGTDFPVEQVNPFLTFYAAVARKDVKGFPEKGFQPENALSREETLKGMTIWAAFSNFEEDERGSIAVGKQADFIMLDQDIMKVALDKVPQTNVLQTYIDGELVYNR